MDTAAIDSAGTKPCAGKLARIAGNQEVKRICKRSGAAAQQRVGAALSRQFDSGPPRTRAQDIGAAFQGVLGLPERENTEGSDKSKQLRDWY